MEENKNEGLYSLEKEQKMLKTSYEMYEKTIRDTRDHLESAIDKNTGKKKYSREEIEEKVDLIKRAEDDIIEKYIKNGGKREDLDRPSERVDDRRLELLNKIAERRMREKESEDVQAKPVEKKPANTYLDFPKQKNVQSRTAYDIIPLPSNGECYASKLGKVPVSYLTAFDENIIASPNLYEENMVIDYILSEKIMSDAINPYDLLDGDRDAIILYLRAAGYGNEYPIRVTDPVTKKQFDTVVDLSTIKTKEFTLKGDDDGYFDFKLPVSGDEIKFKFLTHGDKLDLDELIKKDNPKIMKEDINRMHNTLEVFFKNVEYMDPNMRKKIEEALGTIRDWSDSISPETDVPFTRHLTNTLEMEIMSVNGNTDRHFIHNYVMDMCVRDSSSLRKYIKDNEPGLDYMIKIDKPESLGGGSMEIFLELDQFIFLNVSW